MKNLDQIGGAGGGGGGKDGGGGTRAAVEAPDSLRSTALAKILDLVSEGEIVGLADFDNPLKSVYVNETPLVDAAGNANFSNVSVVQTYGTQGQSYISGFPATEDTQAVGTEVKFGIPVVRVINNPNMNYVLVILGFPSLAVQDPTTGDINGTSVDVAIDIDSNGGGYQRVWEQVITGKCTSRYQRTVRIPVYGTGPWSVRVARGTPDAATVNIQNKSFWDAYVEGVDSKLSFPNSALIGVQFDARQFSSIPQRGYKIYGMKIKVPSNYDPGTASYSGNWDGTFKVAWSNNPAWVFYDLVTNTRYGLGNYIDAASVDKFALYTIAQYCDGLVPDGFGGYERRFTCNLYLQEQGEALTVMQQLASIFRGMAYWGGGQLVATQDAPANSKHIISNSNVKDGLFTYSGSARRVRHTIALVTWNDPTDFYKQKIEYVEDADGISRYGISESKIVAVGCTSRGQAHRAGLWTLLTELASTETVVFKLALEGALVRPGHLFKVLDADRAGLRLGGRILSASANLLAVTIDQTINIDAAKTYSIDIKMPDGTVASATITNTDGPTNTLTLGSVLPARPEPFAMFGITRNDLSPKLFQCVNVTLEEDGYVTVVGLESNQSKYAAVDTGAALETLAISEVQAVPTAPTGVTLSDYVRVAGSGDLISVLHVHWTPPANSTGLKYVVEYRKTGNNWAQVNQEAILATDVDIFPVDDGIEYQVRVYSKNLLGNYSPGTTIATRTIVGKSAPPSDVGGFNAVPSADRVLLSWDDIPDADRHQYEVRRGPSWSDGTTVVVFLGKGTSCVDTPRLAGTHHYLIKAIDTTGNYSVNAVAFDLIVSGIGVPTGIAGPVIDTDMILSWVAPTTQFSIDHYEVHYGTDYPSGTLVGIAYANSIKVPVTWFGNRTFWVTATDLAGNTSAAGSVVVNITAPQAPSVAVAITIPDFKVTWVAPSSVLPIAEYEIRYGADWASGVSLGRVKGTAFQQAVGWGGNRTFFVAAIDSNGNVGAAGSASLFITVPIPPPSLTQQVIDNNVLLTWGDSKQSLPIDHYELYKGVTFATASLVGTVGGRFATFFEQNAGTYTYWVVAVDVAGNPSAPTPITASVNQPPDYILFDDVNSQMDSENVDTFNTLRITGFHYLIGLDGNTQYMRRIISPGDALDIQRGSITMEAWIKPSALGAFQTVFFRGINALNGFSLGVDSLGFIRLGNVAAVFPKSTRSLKAGELIHVIGVIDGINSKIFLNGVRDPLGAGAAAPAQTTVVPTSETDFYIGRMQTSAGVFGNYFGGYIGPCRIYNRIVTDQEALEHYRGIFKDESGLVATWDFEEGFGTSANDDTDNSNDLQLISNPTWNITSLDGRFDPSAGNPAMYYPVSNTDTFEEHFTKYLTGVKITPGTGSLSLETKPPVNTVAGVANMVIRPNTGVLTIPGQPGLIVLNPQVIRPGTGSLSITAYPPASQKSQQDFINLGYTHGLAPALERGRYVEIVDYGTVLAASKVTLTLTDMAVLGNVAITPTISYRKALTDPWTDFVGVYSAYLTQFRYVKITLNMIGAFGNNMRVANGINARLQVKLVNDAGMVNCHANQTLAAGKLTSFGGIATLIAPANIGASIGDLVTIAGANEASYNGVQTVLSVSTTTVTGDTIQFAVSGSPASPATGTITIDAGGTQVNFNVSFVDVTSITVSAQNQPGIQVLPLYDFTDVPNPTGMKVLLFDRSTGNRINGPSSWATKGV